MDRYEQLTAYFKTVSAFHRNRNVPVSNVVALTIDLPQLMEKLTSPRIIARLQSVIAANQHLLPNKVAS